MIIAFFIWFLSAFFLGWIFGFTPDSPLKEIFAAIILLVPSVTFSGLIIRYGLQYFNRTIQGGQPNAWFVLAVAVGLAVGSTFGFYGREHEWFQHISREPNAISKLDSMKRALDVQIYFYTRLTGDTAKAKKILLYKSIGDGQPGMNDLVSIWKWDDMKISTDSLARRILDTKLKK